jgi:hypothetical protein
LALGVLCVLQGSAQGQFATSVISYERGTGYAANFTNSASVLGAPASGSSVTPFAPPFSTSQIVSIGAGGWLSVQLGTPIVNDMTHPFGIDFLVFGNSFFVVTNGSGPSAITSGAIFTSSTSTHIEVSTDAVSWFILDPSLAPTVGTLFPTDGLGDPLLPVNPTLTGADFAGLNLGGVRSVYNGSAGGAGFDLAWARDAQGNGVELESVNYIRIDVLSGRTQVDAISVVPEPRSWVLAALGGAIWWAVQRRVQSRLGKR